MRIAYLLSFFILFVSTAYTQQTLLVDLQDNIRPVTHCASGSLYGLTETLPVDIEALVAPLKPHMFCQPPSGKVGNQHPYGSAIITSERIKNTTGVIQITLADLLPGWPYQWPGKTAWLAMVKDVINEKKASGQTNFHSYQIWNEPEITWLTANGDFYTECWKPTYDLIKSLDPTAKISGPGLSYFSYSRAQEFLTFCKNNNCMPNMFSWHQAGAANFVAWYQSYRQLEIELGIAPLDVCINEYSSRVNDPYEGCPGYAVPLIAKFERYGVESACISWWYSYLPGRLGSLLTESNEKGGGWYLYKWYGDMSGNMIRVTPPNDYSEGLDGFGSIDLEKKFASICIGGNTTGAVDVQITGIPTVWGNKVNVKLEYVTWVNKDLPVAGTTVISTTQYNVVNNSISVPLTIASNLYAYNVYITPVQAPKPPTITFTKPTATDKFVAPATIPIDVLVSDADGTINHINYFINNELKTFHEEWVAPYYFEWNQSQAGTYSIRAVVYDNDGLTHSDTIIIKVNVPQAPYNGILQTIPGKIECENFDVGGNGFAYSDVDAGTNVNPAPNFRQNEDVDIEPCSDIQGGYNIGWAKAGEWLEYTVNVTQAGMYDLVLRVACNGQGRTVSISSDLGNITQNIAIPNTGGWQAWTDVTVNNVHLNAGQQVIRLTIGSIDYVNINYIMCNPVQKPAQSISLKKGWNLIGCPIEGETQISVALESIWDNVLEVKDMNSFYIKGNNPLLNSLTNLFWGRGYMIKVNSDCILEW